MCVSLGGEVTLDLVMIRGGEQLHLRFERQLLRGLVEDDWVQHDVVQVVRDIAGNGSRSGCESLSCSSMEMVFITFVIFSKQGLACARVRKKASGLAGDACAVLARLWGAGFQYAMHIVRR